MDVFLGVDVGTGSARAALFTVDGRMVAHAAEPIRTWRSGTVEVEQSSRDIWRAVCGATRAALLSGGSEVRVRGVGFTATCSLVLVDRDGHPVTVSQSGDAERDVVVWMDHRATAETDFVNGTRAEVLRYVGGRISSEMQVPKLLWLKRNLPGSWAATGHFLDLPDFLTWRATGSLSRSMCSLACKWTYLGHERRWDDGFLRQVGLEDLVADGHARIGTEVRDIGAVAGRVTEAAARELGIPAGVPVGTSIIDAHAGALGLLGLRTDEEAVDFRRRLALIAGTSSCHLAVSAEPTFVPGVWGPYQSALLPGAWLTEGGQTATGALVDAVIGSSAIGAELAGRAQAAGLAPQALLNQRLEALAGMEGCPVSRLTRDLHVYPDFHGNRSPRADASLRGMMSGLPLVQTEDELARLYLATVQALAYGTRHIVETMNRNGFAIDMLLGTGGGTKNELFLRQHADALGMRIVLGEEEEAVLLGAGILAAVAGGSYATLPEAMAAMTRPARVIEPNPEDAPFHDAKYRVFGEMYGDQGKYRRAMEAI
ncbi:FGGY-family carbohydrate kinase [Salinarimonas soli]|uniref:FGGY-family carbohydrate kinase n=1 Tax=Salinarimonas soli TaxID=1638099 RepID=A0A5B2VA68_9HYPH|nr:FGGY-family carbohydrate kinase [Salinarimonas soli]KAA2235628.1 FGGY-family carbohydrate kinase [Salinarimonas soli]